MRYIVAAAISLGLFPSLASAVITVRPEDIHFPIPGQLYSVDVFAVPETLTAGVDENLNAYTFSVSAPQFGPAGGNRPWFVVPGNFTFPINTDPNHQYVFTESDPPFDPTSGSTYNLVFLSAAPGAADTDITETRNGFGRLDIFIPANLLGIVYEYTVTNDFLSLGSSGAPIEAVGGTGRIIIPEPAAAGTLCAAASLALLRRVRPFPWRGKDH